MSDNEQTAAALGHSEILKVQHSPGDTTPPPSHFPEHGAQIPAAVTRQGSADVFPDPDSRERSHLVTDPQALKKETAALPFKPGPGSGDGQILAGRSPQNNVNWREITAFYLPGIVVHPGIGEMSAMHGPGLTVLLAGPAQPETGPGKPRLAQTAARENRPKVEQLRHRRHVHAAPPIKLTCSALARE